MTRAILRPTQLGTRKLAYQDKIMRILYSCLIDMKTDSAPRQHILSVIQELVKQGHTVELVYAGTPSEVLNSPALSVTAVSHHSSKIGRDLALGWGIVRAVRQRPVDIVYHRFTKSSFIPLVCAKLLKKPIVLELNSDLRSDIRHYWDKASLKWKLVEIIERINYFLVDHIIVVSQGVAEAIQTRFQISADKVSIVPNGADLEVFRPMDPVECRHKLGLEVDHYYVAFAGTFQPWQGLETIVNAAYYLQEYHKPINFLIVGDGPEAPRIRKLVSNLGLQNAFHLPGWCCPEKTALYLGASDVCLAPYTKSALTEPSQSKTEGAIMSRSPLKTYSYLAAGRPIIASHFANAGKLVEEIGAGTAVEPESPSALAEAIASTLNDESARHQQGLAARAAAEARFGWDVVAQRITDICGQIVTR